MAKIKKIQESGETIYPATIFQAVKNPRNGQTLEKSFESEHKKLTAGFAYEILGDGQATSEKFSFRPTGGPNRNVRDGSARIEELKGNSAVWNNIVMVDSILPSSQTVNGVTFTNIGNGRISVSTDANGATAQTSLALGAAIGALNHKVLYAGAPIGASTTTCFMYNSWLGMPVNNTIINSALDNFACVLRVPAGAVITTPLVFTPICTNLTKMFGAEVANTITTVEQFYELLPEGVDINAYNEGKIVDANYKAIKTTGFNQFNGTYAKVLGGVKYYLGGTYTSIGYTTEEGGTTEAITIPSDKFYTPSQNGYIYAQGTDICINIAWDEYSALNGTYKPYKPFERDLSWVAKYFPNGMRSAGNVADEIRFNSTTQQWEAVQKVGVVDLGSLTWIAFSDIGAGWFYTPVFASLGGVNILSEKYSITTKLYSQMPDKTMNVIGSASAFQFCIHDSIYTDASTFKAAMQGVMLNYELAEPIVTPITEDVNLAYDVADYGTEQLIVADGAQSAPLSAEVVYEPNVLASIKQVAAMLTRLDVLETAVATMQASAVATTNEE